MYIYKNKFVRLKKLRYKFYLNKRTKIIANNKILIKDNVTLLII